MTRDSAIRCARGPFLHLLSPLIFNFVINFFFSKNLKTRGKKSLSIPQRYIQPSCPCSVPSLNQPAPPHPRSSPCLLIVLPGPRQTGPPVGKALSTIARPQRTEDSGPSLCGAGYPAGWPSPWHPSVAPLYSCVILCILLERGLSNCALAQHGGGGAVLAEGVFAFLPVPQCWGFTFYTGVDGLPYKLPCAYSCIYKILG